MEICSVKRSNNLKYKNVTLSEQIGGLEGYHMTCYRRFTTLSKQYTKVGTAQTSASYLTRSQSNILSTISTGVLSKVCIFCEKKEKKHNNRKQSLVNVEIPNFENKTKEYASLLQDNKMLARIGDIDFVAKETVYHAICRTRYQTRAGQVRKSKVMQTRKTSSWHRSRSIHEEAFQSICHLIQEEII